jgi:hypothetical protein
VICLRHGNAAGQEGGLELEIEKMVKNCFDTARRRFPEAGIAYYPENRPGLGYVRYPFLHFFSTLIDAA